MRRRKSHAQRAKYMYISIYIYLFICIYIYRSQYICIRQNGLQPRPTTPSKQRARAPANEQVSCNTPDCDMPKHMHFLIIMVVHPDAPRCPHGSYWTSAPPGLACSRWALSGDPAPLQALPPAIGATRQHLASQNFIRDLKPQMNWFTRISKWDSQPAMDSFLSLLGSSENGNARIPFHSDDVAFIMKIYRTAISHENEYVFVTMINLWSAAHKLTRLFQLIHIRRRVWSPTPIFLNHCDTQTVQMPEREINFLSWLGESYLRSLSSAADLWPPSQQIIFTMKACRRAQTLK